MIIALVVALLAVTPPPASTASTASVPTAEPQTVAAEPSFDLTTTEALTAAVDDVIADTAMGTKAAFSMAVRHHGRVWHLDRGVVNDKTKQPTTSSTSFRLASITKTFTALAIMQLVQDGELDLDAPAQRFVPALPPLSSSITVRQLLNHTSGIRHYPVKGPERAWRKHLTTAQTLDVFIKRALAFSPGDRFLYTTYGYDVLGAVLEEKTTSAYADVVDERIFTPLGMTATFSEDSRHRSPRWPVGLRETKSGVVVKGDVIDVSSRFAGGGARGTIDDLLRYAEALLAGHLVDDSTWQQMIKPTFTADGLQNDYGLGFAVYPQRGHLIVAHAGGQPETTSLLLLVPAEDLAVVMLTNIEGQGPLQTDVAAAVVEVLVEGNRRRHGVFAVDPVDHVLADGLNRAFSHGRAFVDQVAADISVDDAAIDAAFATFATLTATAMIAASPTTAQQALREAHHPKNGRTSTLVGATLAKLLREASPSTWASLPQRGALAFFADADAVCTKEPERCPPSRRLPAALIARVTKMQQALSSPAAITASSWRRRDLQDVARIRPVLLALQQQTVRPDLHTDLVVVADRLQRRGQTADAAVLRAFDVALYPPPPPRKTAP